MTRGLAFAGGIVAAFGCTNTYNEDDFDDTDDLELEVISCEEAYARLERCCPGFEPRKTAGCIEHAYRKTTMHGCTDYSRRTGAEWPSLSLRESHCIRDTSCADLVAQGICQRGQAASRRTGYSDSSRPTDVPHPVCP